jgi:hypothetical protein
MRITRYVAQAGLEQDPDSQKKKKKILGKAYTKKYYSLSFLLNNLSQSKVLRSQEKHLYWAWGHTCNLSTQEAR